MRVILTLEDYIHYPFLPEAIERVKSLGLTIEELGEGELGEEIIENAKNKILMAIKERILPPYLNDPDIEVASFLASLIILSIIGDSRLIERYSIVFSKSVSRYLSEDYPEKIIYIGSKLLGWQIIKNNSTIKLRVWNYVNHLPEFKGRWKLINKPLDRGWIHVTYKELVRLLENGIRLYIRDMIERVNISPSELPDNIYRAVEEISSTWGSMQTELEKIRMRLGKGRELEVYPPCIRTMMNEIKAGRNITHSARFALAAFLLNIGLSVEEVLEIFKLSPDYRDDIARYQVEHIAGLRGSRTKYTTYKCVNMKSLGLCRWHCQGISHPLQYYFKSIRGKPPYVSEES